jgi:hypothetical protein
VQVIPAHAGAHADQQRLLLSVNYKGTILSVNPGEQQQLEALASNINAVLG